MGIPEKVLKYLSVPAWQPLSVLAVASGVAACCGCGFLHWICLLPLIFLPLMFHWRIVLPIMLISAGCLASGYWSRLEREASQNFAPGRYHGILTVKDTRFTKIGKIAVPSGVNCHFSGKGISCEVRAFFPDDYRRVFYGERFEVSGILLVPSAAGRICDGKKIGKELKLPYQLPLRMRVKICRYIGYEKGFQRLMLQFRDMVLSKVLHGVNSEKYCSMIARFFTGAGSGAPVETRQDFINSGVIHLFAVSGLHVGVLAAVCMLLLRGCSFRISSGITATVVLGYVFLTGCAMSSVRAGSMLVVWCLLRGWLYYTPSWNILCAAWVVLMLFSPASAGDLGVQYSYGITAALILVLERFSKIKQQLCRRADSLRHSNSPFVRKELQKRKWKYRLLISFLISLTAFACGVGISAARQDLFLPGGVAANMVITPLMPLLFGMLLIKLFSGVVGGVVDLCAGKVLVFGFQLLENIARAFADIFSEVPSIRPELFWVLCYYGLFFYALSSRKMNRAAVAFVLAAAILISWPLRAAFAGEKLLLISGAGKFPVLVYMPGSCCRAMVCNVSDSLSAIIAANEMSRRGVKECEVFFSAPLSGAIYGLETLARRCDVKLLHLEPERKYSRYFRRHLNKREFAYTRNHSLLLPERNRWNFAFDKSVEFYDRDCGREIVLKSHGKTMVRELLPWSSEKLIRSYDLRR